MNSRAFLVGGGALLAATLAASVAPDVAAQSPARTPLGARDVARVAAHVVVPRVGAMPGLGSRVASRARGVSRVRGTRADTVAMYTADQLTAGTETYNKVCKGCHEDTDYTNDKFKSAWSGKTLLELYGYVHDKMPDDNPGSLTPDEYAGSIAYILKLNGVPAGANKVMPDSAAMKAITLNFAAGTK